MKKKILIFTSLITLILSFMLITPKPKALDLYDDYNAMVINWDDVDNVYITYFDGDITYTNLYNIYNVTDINNVPILLNYRFIRGIKLYITNYVSGVSMVGNVVLDNIYKSKSDLVVYFTYNYIKTENNYYYFQRDLDFYKIPVSEISFTNSIGGVVEFSTTLKAGNEYVYYGGNDMRFNNSKDYQFFLASELASVDVNNAYELGKTQGYNDGYSKGLEDLESAKIIAKEQGRTEGYLSGYQIGYNEGYNKAVEDISTSDEYETGYENGYRDGLNDKKLENNNKFYNSIEKWLVPAVITVIVLGGIMSITVFKRRDQ